MISLFVILSLNPSHAQIAAPAPRVLVVTAHPDDEYFFAGTIYRITHDLGGTVDQVVITDGRGGFRYSTLSQPLYKENLTDQAIAAEKLPAIRKKELEESGKILGVRQHFFLNRLDQKTLDLNETYAMWNGKEAVKSEIKAIIAAENYDYIFTLIPTETNHGHHKAAGILALEVINEMPATERPVILGSFARYDGDSAESAQQDDPVDAREYVRYQDNALTEVKPGITFSFDRAMKFGFNNNLSYQIPVNWMIAAHKSQGAFQNSFSKHRYEAFKVFAINSENATALAQTLFDRLQQPTPISIFQN